MQFNVGSVDFSNANSNTVSTTREMLDHHRASLSDQHSAGFRAHRISMAALATGFQGQSGQLQQHRLSFTLKS